MSTYIKNLLVFLLIFSFTTEYTMAFGVKRITETTNHIGMKFIEIPNGSFYMGSCPPPGNDKGIGTAARVPGLAVIGMAIKLMTKKTCPSEITLDQFSATNEQPVSQQEIGHGLMMGTQPVSLGEFKRFIEGVNRKDLLTEKFRKGNRHGDNAPVVMVSSQDAANFIKWLNESKPEKDQGTYRLPTEIEWEYSVRAGTSTAFFFGSDDKKLTEYSWYDNTSSNTIHPVAMKKANPWGLYDMSGNVREWVDDWYLPNHNRASRKKAKHGNPAVTQKVVRGGSWADSWKKMRSAARQSLAPDTRDDKTRFRVLRKRGEKEWRVKFSLFGD